MTSLRWVPAAVVAGIALVGPLFAPRASDDGVDIPFAAPSASAPLGTDHLGRDVLSQLLSGGWGLLLLAVLIAVLVTTLAAVIGAVAALLPRAGKAIESATDLLMLVPPVLAILLVMLSWPGSGAVGLVVVAVVVGTPYCARVFAAAASGVAAAGYVEVARAGGEPLARLVVGEVLPNLGSTFRTQLGLRFVEAMYVVSTAAFLRLPTTWGETNWALMVRENSAGILLNPWSVIAPCVAIGLLAVTVNTAIGSAATERIEVRR